MDLADAAGSPSLKYRDNVNLATTANTPIAAVQTMQWPATAAADRSIFEMCGECPPALDSFHGSIWPLLTTSTLCPHCRKAGRQEGRQEGRQAGPKMVQAQETLSMACVVLGAFGQQHTHALL
jgi:hypothetical protein